MVKSIHDTYTLNNGVKIPCVGYGTYKASDGKTSEIILAAIQEGYRYMDTAAFYETEGYVGEAVRKSGIPREEFFISSKVWRTQMGYEQTLKEFHQSLERLQMDYMDMYLIHWPVPDTSYKDWKKLDIDTWRAMEEVYKAGKVRAIGLSNFLPHHLDNILENCEIKPTVDQLEYHPGYTQEAAVQYCKQNDILVQAWSPVARMKVANDETIVEIAEKYGVSVPKICLRFCIQNGIVTLPKASTRERMRQNIDLFDFEISDEDMKRLNTLPQVGWSGEHPDRVRVGNEDGYGWAKPLTD